MSATTQFAIHGLLPQELAEWCASRHLPAYRARQIWRWLYVQRAATWAAMSNLSLSLRQELAAAFILDSATALQVAGAAGGTQKILVGLPDGESVEAVLIPARDWTTVCVSSQVGCRFGCAFCASGQQGLVRDLSAGEMVGEVLLAARQLGKRPEHVVWMGMGEPLDNYEPVLKAVRIINDQDGLGIGARHITLSTSGLIPGIRRLMAEGLQVELSVSLHAPDNDLRSRLMPVNRRYPLAELMDACRDYTAQTGRIITFEYTLIAGVNTALAQAKALATLLKSIPGARVNLIPLSSVAEYAAPPLKPETSRAFQDALTQAGINATLRVSKGGEINAACGQLRRRAIENRTGAGATNIQ